MRVTLFAMEHKAASPLQPQSDKLPGCRRHTFLRVSPSSFRVSVSPDLSTLSDSQSRLLFSRMKPGGCVFLASSGHRYGVTHWSTRRGDRAAPLFVAYLEVRWLQIPGQ